MRQHGATRIFAKALSPNDNSKNQIYLGSGFAALNVVPHGDIYIDTEEKAGSKQDRPKAAVTFFWIDEEGRHPAPGANLILYPDYPEVRISGLLRGCREAPSDLIRPRLEGRVMFFGVTPEREVLGYVVADGDPIGNEVKAGRWDELGVFLEMPLLRGQDPRALLLAELLRIHRMGWIDGQRIKGGQKVPYSAPNAGGYTLEAELGIAPNGVAEPDFMGWEVKQYGVSSFQRLTPKSAVTLMTPEPTEGLYKADRIGFVRRFGYADTKGRAGRINFGGTYKCDGKPHRRTRCQMSLVGFDPVAGIITDMEGGIVLSHATGGPISRWSFKAMMDHWNRKHAQAAYVPSLSRTPPRQYNFGNQVLLCEQTDFILFLKAFVRGEVYYDPGIKLVDESGKARLKGRSQFRINQRQLTKLYHSNSIVDLLNP